MRVIVCNAFSLSMLPEYLNVALIRVEKLTAFKVIELLTSADVLESAIGHESTVQIFNKLFGTNLQKNRVRIVLEKGVTLIVMQIKERLPEGVILSYEEIEQLLTENKIEFYKVELIL